MFYVKETNQSIVFYLSLSEYLFLSLTPQIIANLQAKRSTFSATHLQQFLVSFKPFMVGI